MCVFNRVIRLFEKRPEIIFQYFCKISKYTFLIQFSMCANHLQKNIIFFLSSGEQVLKSHIFFQKLIFFAEN